MKEGLADWDKGPDPQRRGGRFGPLAGCGTKDSASVLGLGGTGRANASDGLKPAA